MQIIETLKHWDALRADDQIMTERLPAIPPETVPAANCAGLSTQVRGALGRLSCSELYDHQARAITAGVRGANVVLQAPTASGKSLAFQVPMIEALLRDPSGHALMLYPTKALAFDQRDQLQRLTEAIPDCHVQSWWYDGDVTPSERDGRGAGIYVAWRVACGSERAGTSDEEP